MSRKAGAGAAVMSGLTARRQHSGESALIEAAVPRAAAGSGDSGGISIALADIAPHPQNRREDLGDVSDIRATLSTLGLLQMPVLATRGAMLAVYPDYADAIGSRPYVTLIGHRRIEACRQEGWATVEARIADQLVDTSRLDVETMLAENLHRANLNPVEEAKAYRDLVDAGRSQRELEKRLGVPQSQIAKRLALLKLAPSLQILVIGGRVPHYNDGPIPLTEAAEYARLDVADQMEAWELAKDQGLRASNAIREYQTAVVRREGLAAAMDRAKAEGIRLVDASGAWGPQAQAVIVSEPDEIESARQAGNLRGSVDALGNFAYAVEIPQQATGADSGGISRRRQRPEDSGERSAAAAARDDACQRIAARRPHATEAVRRLAAGMVERHTSYGEALRMAHQWLAAAGVGPDSPDPATFRDTIRESGDGGLLTQLAFAVALAYDELRARETRPTWDRRDVEHLDRLIGDTRYAPTAWEANRLAEARALIPAESEVAA